MNYLAAYNKQITRVRKETWKNFFDSLTVTILYSRYNYIEGRFSVKIPLTSINIKEIEDGIIGFTFNVRGAYFKDIDNCKEEWETIFLGLKEGFSNKEYLDIKEKFLEATDEKSLSNLLNKLCRKRNLLDSDLGKELIEVFRKTDMYKNICNDCDNVNRNYKEATKSNNQEYELFKLKFLSTGKIKMLLIENGKENFHIYDDFDSVIDIGISASRSWYTITKRIKDEYELFREHL